MKRLYLAGALYLAAIVAGFVLLYNRDFKQHRCIDITHQECDGNCECDGMGCVTAVNNSRVTYQIVPLRDYQIEIVVDSLLIYDGKRHVGTIPFFTGDNTTPIDSLIMVDND